MTLSVNDGGEDTLIGFFPLIDEGEYIEATGEYVEHPSYGTQFKAESYSITEPDDTDSMLRYLSSGAVKGPFIVSPMA